MEISIQQLAKHTTIIYAGVMDLVGEPLTKDEFIDVYNASLEDINNQIKDNKGVVNIDKMFEEFKNACK